MRQALGGPVLVIIAIAAFIEAHIHRPEVRHALPRFSLVGADAGRWPVSLRGADAHHGARLSPPPL
jgi:hypothetical protein